MSNNDEIQPVPAAPETGEEYAGNQTDDQMMVGRKTARQRDSKRRRFNGRQLTRYTEKPGLHTRKHHPPGTLRPPC